MAGRIVVLVAAFFALILLSFFGLLAKLLVRV